MSSASDRPPEFGGTAPPAKRRLVIAVLSDTVMLYNGICAPADVAVPPVHVRIRSPISSVIPSERTCGGTGEFAVQTNGGAKVACAEAETPVLSTSATTANAKSHLRKSAISFSLWYLLN